MFAPNRYEDADPPSSFEPAEDEEDRMEL